MAALSLVEEIKRLHVELAPDASGGCCTVTVELRPDQEVEDAAESLLETVAGWLAAHGIEAARAELAGHRFTLHAKAGPPPSVRQPAGGIVGLRRQLAAGREREPAPSARSSCGRLTDYTMTEAVRIDAPDPLRAFILWQCLRTVGAELVELVDGRFEVRVPDDPSRRLSVPETLAIVRRWLEHERIDCTRVHIDGHPQMLRCAHSAQAGVRRNHTFSAAKARR